MPSLKDAFRLTSRCTKAIKSAVNNNTTFTGVADDLFKAKDPSLWTFGVQRKVVGQNGKVAQRAVAADSTYGQTLQKADDFANKYEVKNNVIFDKNTGKPVMEDATERRLYDGRKVAAAAMALPVGYRFLSGGGVYRDKDGNVDWVGIPFF